MEDEPVDRARVDVLKTQATASVVRASTRHGGSVWGVTLRGRVGRIVTLPISVCHYLKSDQPLRPR